MFVSATAALSYHALTHGDSSKYLSGGLVGPTTVTTWFAALLCALLYVLIGFYIHKEFKKLSGTTTK